MSSQFFAHSLDYSFNEAEWQPLMTHLEGVASRARGYTEAFQSGEHGTIAGLWHDLGKYQPEFQRRIRGESIQVRHAAVGAALAYCKNPANGLPVAFAIAGHHAGLANLRRSENGAPIPLMECIADAQKGLKTALKNAPNRLAELEVPVLPLFLCPDHNVNQAEILRRNEFWTRLLFSALVDADRLDTEAFCDPENAEQRGAYESITTLCDRLRSYVREMMNKIPEPIRQSPVNEARAKIVGHCLRAAHTPPGFFSLTVPTGGGKTLSGALFALAHAETHDLHRVIVVIPYTSIIEQNASVYRAVLGERNVIEHHSNFDTETKCLDESYALYHALACENWDAPFIVTTTVQFFESLFSNHPSQCRKLHNIAQSVIVLDEVQTLPPGFLSCILDGLNNLVRHYGCSVVLSTATPPALAKRQTLPDGLPDVFSIFPEPNELTERLKRVEFTWPTPKALPKQWSDLAQDIVAFKQVLVIVHRRKDARDLAQQIQSLVLDESIFHLSALMCPAHRLDVLEQIRKALKNGRTCRVVSTQLVEAGVDIDFPVVYRALGGLDSIVQAAGRCNREGQLKAGRVIIFRSPTEPPPGTLRKAFDVTCSMLEKTGALDTSNVAVFEEYFRRLYFVEDRDLRSIQAERAQLNFATVATRFKLIEDGYTRSVIVPYSDSEERLAQLKMLGPSKQRARGLQRFTVNIPTPVFDQWLRNGAVEEASEGFFSLTSPYYHLYDSVYGLLDSIGAHSWPTGLFYAPGTESRARFISGDDPFRSPRNSGGHPLETSHYLARQTYPYPERNQIHCLSPQRGKRKGQSAFKSGNFERRDDQALFRR